MSKTSTSLPCKCGNSACAFRASRGLPAFCQMTAPVREERGYGSYVRRVQS